MHTILGAGGAIGAELVPVLFQQSLPVRVVGRSPKLVPGAAEAVAADISDLDQTIEAVAGSKVVYLLVGLKYDYRTWVELWPRIMRNAIEACKRARARLIFFDNVYMYGKVSGPMTEETRFNPCSRKGEIRAQIATTLLREMEAGDIQALIARAADFYGPRVRTSGLNVLVFDNFAKGARASWLLDDSVPHSFTYTPDAAKSLALLAASETAWNQTWHLPTAANPPTGKEFVQKIAAAFGVEPNYRVLGRPLVRIAGWFKSDIRELYEMLYQNDSAYLFDSSKFHNAFDFSPTDYTEGIKRTAEAYPSATR